LNREKLLSIPAFAWGYQYWRHMMDVVESMEVWKASRRLAADAARMFRARWIQYKRVHRSLSSVARLAWLYRRAGDF
ncbi:MAG TPA: hypothetical protein VN345_12980, partial [Blastocatellia bacterium]|nr:hypothetical protein [Blastocatellia bacterium]